MSAAPLQHLVKHPARSFANARYRLREAWRRQTAQVNPNPIFVFGNQKSGTSAVAALLGEATGLSYTIDILCLYSGLEEKLLRGEAKFDQVLERGRYYFSKDIVKDPGFTLFYNQIANLFPNTQRVFVLRDPYQNIRSILNRVRLPGDLENLSAEQWQNLKQQFPGWYPVLDGSLAGHHGETYIETLALRCQKIAQIYLQHQADLVPIYYEAFNQNKVEAIRELALKLGLEPNRSIEQVKDVQFQPKGNQEVSLEAFFGAANLHRIEKICGEVMGLVGYPSL